MNERIDVSRDQLQAIASVEISAEVTMITIDDRRLPRISDL